MQKAQISIDALLAFIALMLLLQFLLSFVSNLSAVNEESYLISQMKNIAFTAKEAFDSCKIIKFPNSNARLSIAIPKIKGIKEKIKECKLKIENNEITISLKTSQRDLNFSIPLPEYSGTETINCGEVLNVEC